MKMDIVWWPLTALTGVCLLRSVVQRLKAASRRIDDDITAFNRDHPRRDTAFVVPSVSVGAAVVTLANLAVGMDDTNSDNAGSGNAKEPTTRLLPAQMRPTTMWRPET